ncbi:MAG TPA: hypothetical protein VFC63_04875 [Blastocatellia bacterium]|nr:hypothetical protein [Blastocatellia bacterium]
MNPSLVRLAQQKPVLGIVQFVSAFVSVAAFFLFYVVLGNALWIAGPLSVVVFVALWQLLVAPIQKQVIKAQAGIQNLVSIEKKIASLQAMAERIANPAIKGKVHLLASHFYYALQVQRSKPEPLAAITAQTLTGVALGSTCNLISSYLTLTERARLNSDEQQSIANAEDFIDNLTVATEDQVARLKGLLEGGTDAETGIEANISALQVVFNIERQKEKGAL